MYVVYFEVHLIIIALLNFVFSARIYIAWIANNDDNEHVNTMMGQDLQNFPAFVPRRFQDERLVSWVYSGLSKTGASP